MSVETVKMRVSVEISAEDVVDTGLTVEQWNALTDTERSEHYQEAWSNLAEGDNGGVEVLTDGAKQC